MDVKAPDEGRYLFGPFVLNPAQRELLRDGVPLTLTYRLFETLLVFVRNPGRILTKDELLEAIWPGRYMKESSLKQASSCCAKRSTTTTKGKWRTGQDRDENWILVLTRLSGLSSSW
jgi:hypothetical protein